MKILLASQAVLALVAYQVSGTRLGEVPHNRTDPEPVARELNNIVHSSPLKVVVIGDSSAAGNGARDANGNRNYEPGCCYRSPTNWAGHFSKCITDAGRPVHYVNAACHGAHVDDYKTDGQLRSIGQETDLVMISIGANDLYFSDIVTQCFYYKDTGDCSDYMNKAKEKLPQTKTFTTDLLLEVRKRSRVDTKVVLVGYPYGAMDDSFKLWDVLSFSWYRIAKKLRAFQRELDIAQEGAVNDANVAAGATFAKFENIKDLFKGHEPNPELGEANSDRWIHELESLTYMAVETWHYNAKGHRNLGEHLCKIGGDYGAGDPVASGCNYGHSDYELFDKDTKIPLQGSCNAFDQVYKDLCPAVDANVPNPEYLPPGGSSPTCSGYCCASWGSGGTCPNSWQNTWRRAFPSVIVPKCDGKEQPDECEVVLVRKNNQDWPDAACSVSEGNWIFPSIQCWTGNGLTSEIRIGKGTKVTLCKHAPNCYDGGREYIRTESAGPQSVTFDSLSELRVECASVPRKRRVTVWGSMRIKDDEVTKDKFYNRRVYATLDVEPGGGKESKTVKHCVGGEIRVEVTFTASLNKDNTVDVDAYQKIFEGTSCTTTDHEKEADACFSINLAENTYQAPRLNSDTTVGGNDYAHTSLFIVNGDLDPSEWGVSVSGTLRVKDDDYWKDKISTLTINDSFTLSNLQRSAEKSWSRCAGGEARGEIDAYFFLLPDGAIAVHSFHRLYEGTSCSTNDLEDEGTWHKVIPTGTSAYLDVKLDNDGDDTSHARLTIASIGPKT